MITSKMNINYHMNKLLIPIIVLPFFLVGCNTSEVAQNEETVQVRFCAEIPEIMGTRAGSDLTVDKVYCAVFENGEELNDLRKEITIEQGTPIVYAPRLVKDRTYDVVFWASKDGSYDVTDMTQIVRSVSGPANESDYDAFTATDQITVQNAISKPITLTRPLAQLNIGITEPDWKAVSDTFGQTPSSISITYNEKDIFNALTGSAVSSYSDITRTSACSGSLTVDGVTYRQLGTFYVLMAEEDQKTINLKYSVYDTSDQPIRSDVDIIHIPVQRNFKTNIVGGLLTGTISYGISISEGFSNIELNKEL